MSKVKEIYETIENDEQIMATIEQMIKNHTRKQPYAHNTLVRIKDLLERYGI